MVWQVRWWCCGEGIQLRHERRLSANQERRRRCDRNFLSGRSSGHSGVAIEYNLYRNMGNIICAQNLNCLKSKYPSVLSARWVSRYRRTHFSSRLPCYEVNTKGLWKRYILQDLLWRAYPDEEDPLSWTFESSKAAKILSDAVCNQIPEFVSCS